MELVVYNLEKKVVGKVDGPEPLFGKVRTALIHQVLVQQRENRRQGNARVKSRHEVSGSTRKIYRQKGTGRARHGDIKAPLFVGGGQAFGPKSRSWYGVVPKKMSQGALGDAVSAKRSEEKFLILDSLNTQKTKEAAALFEKFGLTSGLVVLEPGSTAQRSIRNLASFKPVAVHGIHLEDLLRYEHLIMTKAAYEKFIERFS